MPSPFDAVTSYFLAKDGNRPHLLRRVFVQEAELEMVVKTDAISFPDSARGLDAMEEALVRRFSDEFENVYTFGLSRPTAADRHHFPCYWLVGASAKRKGSVRIGCGRYDWYFAPDERCLAERLFITIEMMQVFSDPEADGLMAWLSGLPYPWCRPEEALAAMPNIEGLLEIRRYLNAVPSASPD